MAGYEGGCFERIAPVPAIETGTGSFRLVQDPQSSRRSFDGGGCCEGGCGEVGPAEITAVLARLDETVCGGQPSELAEGGGQADDAAPVGAPIAYRELDHGGGTGV